MKHIVWVLALIVGLGVAGTATAAGEEAVKCHTGLLKLFALHDKLYFKLRATGCKKGMALPEDEAKAEAKMDKAAEKFQEFLAKAGATACDPDDDYTNYDSSFQTSLIGVSDDSLDAGDNECNGADDT